MDKIWAPWRIGYIKQRKIKGCILCNAYKSKSLDVNYVVLRSLYCFAMLNRFPYTNGHLMIIPNRHVSALDKLNTKEILDMNNTLIKMISTLKKVLKPHGFNIGINIGKFAGAGIDKHIHMHLVPRWLGDTNFMPTVAATKVISQSLKELYTQIKKYL